MAWVRFSGGVAWPARRVARAARSSGSSLGFAPGSTASPLTDAHVEATTAGIPMGRASLPEDAPNAIMFVCSGKAAYITGATLSVDGGNSIGSMMVYQDKKHPG